jgi:hypothetical protein
MSFARSTAVFVEKKDMIKCIVIVNINPENKNS